MEITFMGIETITLYARNARKIPQQAIDKVATSIQEFGWRQPIVIDGLWTLALGGGLHSSPDTLFFTAGPNHETDGLFGTITPLAP